MMLKVRGSEATVKAFELKMGQLEERVYLFKK